MFSFKTTEKLQQTPCPENFIHCLLILIFYAKAWDYMPVKQMTFERNICKLFEATDWEGLCYKLMNSFYIKTTS